MTERLDRIEGGIETLMAACSTNLTAIRETAGTVDKLTERAKANETRFETLLSEMRADRQETAQLWNDARAQADADRTEAREQAEADRAAIKAQSDTDRAENARRFDAQQETIQRLLLAIVDLGRDNNRLRDRLDGLEQAS